MSFNFVDLEVGRLYRVRTRFGDGDYRISWLKNAPEIGLVVDYKMIEDDPTQYALHNLAIKRMWATFLIDDRLFHVVRPDEDHPWSIYFELVR